METNPDLRDDFLKFLVVIATGIALCAAYWLVH